VLFRIACALRRGHFEIRRTAPRFARRGRALDIDGISLNPSISNPSSSVRPSGGRSNPFAFVICVTVSDTMQDRSEIKFLKHGGEQKWSRNDPRESWRDDAVRFPAAESKIIPSEF